MELLADIHWFLLQAYNAYINSFSSPYLVGIFGAFLTAWFGLTIITLYLHGVMEQRRFRRKVRAMSPEEKKALLDQRLEDAITDVITQASVEGILTNQEAEAQYRRAADRLGLVGLLPKAYDGAKTWQMVEAFKRILKAKHKKQEEPAPAPVQTKRQPRNALEASLMKRLHKEVS